MCKKMTFLVFSVFVLSMASHVAAELVGYWTFDEGTGTIVVDSSTYGNDGNVEGTPEWVMGQVGLDKSKLAVFSGDWSPPIQEVMDNSVTNDSVFRGTMQIVGPQINGKGYPLEEATYMLLKDLAEGNLTYGHVITDAIQKAYPQG